MSPRTEESDRSEEHDEGLLNECGDCQNGGQGRRRARKKGQVEAQSEERYGGMFGSTEEEVSSMRIVQADENASEDI